MTSDAGIRAIRVRGLGLISHTSNFFPQENTMNATCVGFHSLEVPTCGHL